MLIALCSSSETLSNGFNVSPLMRGNMLGELWGEWINVWLCIRQTFTHALKWDDKICTFKIRQNTHTGSVCEFSTGCFQSNNCSINVSDLQLLVRIYWLYVLLAHTYKLYICSDWSGVVSGGLTVICKSLLHKVPTRCRINCMSASCKHTVSTQIMAAH